MSARQVLSYIILTVALIGCMLLYPIALVLVEPTELLGLLTILGVHGTVSICIVVELAHALEPQGLIWRWVDRRKSRKDFPIARTRAQYHTPNRRSAPTKGW